MVLSKTRRLSDSFSKIIFSLAWACTCGVVRAAEPYISTPPELKDCKKPDVKIPNGARSLYYPSDECGTIFVGPPSKIQTAIAAAFTAITKDDCSSISKLILQKAKIIDKQVEFSQKLIDNSLKPSEILEEKNRLKLAMTSVDEALDGDYKIWGSKTSITIEQDWLGNINLYKAENPAYQVLPLPTVGGIVSFDERIPPAKLEAFGLYDNADRRPYISYTVSGLPLLPADSPIADGDKLPIFFPLARAERANLKSVQYGGGAVTASVEFNKAGFCQLTDNASKQDPIAFLAPTITFNMALKTSGTYTTTISIDYLIKTLNEISTETSGTYYASAVADAFYSNRSSTTVSVELNNDLKNSLSQVQQEAFVQQVLFDAANQFLATITGKAGERVAMPAVPAVEKYKTIQTARRVCSRSGGLFGSGLFSSSNCWDQAYNIQVLQDTTQVQAAEQRVRGVFKGKQESRVRSYVLVPWNAAL